MIALSNIFPTKEQYREIDLKEDVYLRYMSSIERYKLLESIVPSKKIFKENEIRKLELTRDGKGLQILWDDSIDLFPFFKEGWDKAVSGYYGYSNAAYKKHEWIISKVQEKYKDVEFSTNYFENLSKQIIDEVTDGMAHFLYYVWLIDGDIESESFKELSLKYTFDQIIALYPKLEHYIQCDSSSLLHWIGQAKCSNPQKIKWMVLNRQGQPHKTAFREFLSKLLTVVPSQKIIDTVFIDLMGNPIKLAKPKKGEFSNYFAEIDELI